jgi:hypothetical protein
MLTARMPPGIGTLRHSPRIRGVALSLSGESHLTSWKKVIEPCDGAFVWDGAPPKSAVEVVSGIRRIRGMAKSVADSTRGLLGYNTVESILVRGAFSEQQPHVIYFKSIKSYESRLGRKAQLDVELCAPFLKISIAA